MDDCGPGHLPGCGDSQLADTVYKLPQIPRVARLLRLAEDASELPKL
jgi:hypothetical protein